MNSTGKCSSTPHGRLSQLVDIGPFGPTIARLDAGLESCLSAVQGLLIHTDNLYRYPVGPQLAARASRETLSVRDRL